MNRRLYDFVSRHSTFAIMVVALAFYMMTDLLGWVVWVSRDYIYEATGTFDPPALHDVQQDMRIAFIVGFVLVMFVQVIKLIAGESEE